MAENKPPQSPPPAPQAIQVRPGVFRSLSSSSIFVTLKTKK